MARALRAVAGLVFALLALGLALQPLLAPALTRALSARYSVAERSGLTPAEEAAAAESVRAYVAGERPALPAAEPARPALDAAAVSHLRDVRAVVGLGRALTLGSALLAAAIAVICVVRGALRPLAGILMWGAGWTVALVAAAGLAGTLSFDELFAAFHQLFFAAGTWQFPYDSLLIRLFPEPFWTVSAAAWAAGALMVAAVYASLGWWLVARSSAEHGPSGGR